MLCNDAHCVVPEHKQDIDDAYEFIKQAIIYASYSTLLRNDRGPGPGLGPGKTPVVLAQSSPGPGFFAEKTGVLTGVLTTGVPGFPPVPR